MCLAGGLCILSPARSHPTSLRWSRARLAPSRAAVSLRAKGTRLLRGCPCQCKSSRWLGSTGRTASLSSYLCPDRSHLGVTSSQLISPERQPMARKISPHIPWVSGAGARVPTSSGGGTGLEAPRRPSAGDGISSRWISAFHEQLEELR